MIKVVITHCWDDQDEYLVPVDTTKPDQFVRELHRSNRNLLAGRRFRGDVGSI